MRKYNESTEILLEEMKCNKCGKSMQIENGIVKEGVFSVEYNWGYFSKKDGQQHIIDLCESCYDELIKEFELQVDIKENVELL